MERGHHDVRVANLDQAVDADAPGSDGGSLPSVYTSRADGQTHNVEIGAGGDVSTTVGKDDDSCGEDVRAVLDLAHEEPGPQRTSTGGSTAEDATAAHERQFCPPPVSASDDELPHREVPMGGTAHNGDALLERGRGDAKRRKDAHCPRTGTANQQRGRDEGLCKIRRTQPPKDREQLLRELRANSGEDTGHRRPGGDRQHEGPGHDAAAEDGGGTEAKPYSYFLHGGTDARPLRPSADGLGVVHGAAQPTALTRQQLLDRLRRSGSYQAASSSAAAPGQAAPTHPSRGRAGLPAAAAAASSCTTSTFPRATTTG